MKKLNKACSSLEKYLKDKDNIKVLYVLEISSQLFEKVMNFFVLLN